MQSEKRAAFKQVAGCILIALLAAGCATTRSGKDIQSVQLVQSGASWDGRPLPAYATGTPEITILRITIPPGQTLPMHRHPVINAGVLLKGELTVQTENGDVLHLRPHDPIVEVVDTWHWGKNEGDTPAEIIVFYAGEKGAAITVKESEGGSSGGKEP
jgi:quercetin dioxygenase-like cupin family protein